MIKLTVKSGLKHGIILGIKITSTTKKEVLKFVDSRLDLKEKFYIVTPNPEIVLMAKSDWLLKKAIAHSDIAVPDGVGLAMASKFLSLEEYQDKKLLRIFSIFWQGIRVGLATFFDRDYLYDNLELIKGRELFLEIVKIAANKNLKVCLVGGEKDEAELTRLEILKDYPSLMIRSYKTPQYNKNGQPDSVIDRKMHKVLLGKLKMYEPDFIFVALNAPKQEKWIFRNFFRLNSIGAMSVGGTFNYVAKKMKLPPKWLERIGLEWVYRLIQEPKRLNRIINATIIFPWNVYLWKLNPPRRA